MTHTRESSRFLFIRSMIRRGGSKTGIGLGILYLVSFLFVYSGCGNGAVDVSTEEPMQNPIEDIFFMDFVPATGFGLYTANSKAHDTMSGGIFRLNGDDVEVVTEDLIFPHNIEPFGEGYIVTDTDLESILLVNASGETVRTIDEVVWLDGQRESLRNTNWVLPLKVDEVERFVGSSPSRLPLFMICKGRTIGDESWMWWAICTLHDEELQVLWEEKSPGRKVHTALIHDGVFYGAASHSRTLVIVGGGLDFELPVGDIRYMEVKGEKLWMAGDGFVGVFDRLPPEKDEAPRVFAQGIGRTQAVHEYENEVFVTANGHLLIFDLEGNVVRSFGHVPPESGESWVHDKLRALGYLE